MTRRIDGVPMNRRAALKWVMALSAVPLIGANPFNAVAGPSGEITDPDLLHPKILWNRILTETELGTLASLCDVILPADERSPSASSLHVQDFIDEWVSAPYPKQDSDRKIVREGVDWLNRESKKRFEKPFAGLADEQKASICNDICFVPKAKPEFKDGAVFFAKARDLAMSAYYTTVEGMKDLDYRGNVPLASFTGPPKEVLEKLGLVG